MRESADLDVERWASWIGLETFGDPDLLNMAKCVGEWRQAIFDRLSPRWLSLVGASGTGKSFCAYRLEKSLKTRKDWNCDVNSYYPSLVHWPSFIERLRNPDDEAAWGRYREMNSWKYLILDDLFAERDSTGFATEKLGTLLGCRDGRWTLITSNLSLSDIAQAETRIADRMMRGGSLVVDVRCPSYALRTKGPKQ